VDLYKFKVLVLTIKVVESLYNDSEHLIHLCDIPRTSTILGDPLWLDCITYLSSYVILN